MRKTAQTLALALISVVSLSGCLPPALDPTPTPQPSSTPVFASEEEAMKAAEAAYREYLAVSDAIAQDGGANPERLAGLVTEEFFAKQLETITGLQSDSLHTTGATTFDSFSAQQYVDDYAGTALLTAYACIDVSGVRVLNEVGADVTPAGRQDRLPLLLDFEASDPMEVRVSASDTWDGDDFCAG
jgi:hypothetical protein